MSGICVPESPACGRSCRARTRGFVACTGYVSSAGRASDATRRRRADNEVRRNNRRMARIRDVVFDCRHPASLARFWAAVLDDYAVAPYDDAELDRLRAMGVDDVEDDPAVLVEAPGRVPRLFFQRVPEPKPREEPSAPRPALRRPRTRDRAARRAGRARTGSTRRPRLGGARRSRGQRVLRLPSGLAGRRTGFDQIPGIAVAILEHDDRAVRFDARFATEVHAAARRRA